VSGKNFEEWLMNLGFPFVTTIDTVLLRVQNLESAAEWYTHVLGFKPVYTAPEERLIVLAVGTETSLTLHKQGSTSATVTHQIPRCYPIFYTPDIEAAHERLRAIGVEVQPISGKEGETRWFAFRDGEGNYLEMCHYETSG
jgi:catechol 2,3-dioxygenase-like lactoylglutathione lyase family enzyme